MTAAAPARRSILASSQRRAAIVGLIGRRLLSLLPVLLAMILVTFGLMHLAPGSPWDPELGQGAGGVQLSPVAIRHLNAHYGLDKPWLAQLGIYMVHAARFDFGESYQYRGLQVRELIARRWPRTLEFGLISLGFIVPFGLGLGLLAALRRNTWLDYAITGMATLGASIPSFVVGLLLIILLSVTLNRLTSGGFHLPSGGFGLDEHLIMPVLSLSLLPVAFLARLTRAGAIEALGQDHVQAARGRGLEEPAVVVRHVLKNALVPVVSALGPLSASLVAGTVVVETLFGMRGLGATFVEAVSGRDYPMIMGLTILFTVLVGLANLVVDVLYVVIDPRVTPR